MSDASTAGRSPRVLTGRMVLFCFLAFFGTIFAMNVFMVRVALSSFSGVETESAYKAGLTFKQDAAAAKAQDERHWAVGANLKKGADGTLVTLSVRDPESRPLAGLATVARLSHPTDKRKDVVLELTETSPGQFEGWASTLQGQWDLVIELKRNAETVFRSKSRVIL